MVKSEKSKCFVVRCLQIKEKRPVEIITNGTFFIVLIHTFSLLNSHFLIKINAAQYCGFE